MNLLKIATVPPSTVPPGATVLDAVRRMVKDKVGAVAVVADGKLRGIFTERDLMLKVVHRDLPVATTPVGDVMTTNVMTVPVEGSGSRVVKTMLRRHFRHAPVVNDSGEVAGMLSLRDLLRNQVEDLDHELLAIVSYVTADGPGG